jgi:hypothetical protein
MIKPFSLSVLGLLLLLACPFYTVLAQKTISGVTLPSAMILGKDKLILNGAGIREKYFMDMYVAGLYLLKSTSDPTQIIAANEPMILQLNIVSSLITSEKMKEAVKEGFSKSTNGNTSALQKQIDQFQAAFSEEIKKGDVFQIQYNGSDVMVFKNGKLKVSISGLEFKKALFGIWLCNQPADEDLKENLLGKA